MGGGRWRREERLNEEGGGRERERERVRGREE